MDFEVELECGVDQTQNKKESEFHSLNIIITDKLKHICFINHYFTCMFFQLLLIFTPEPDIIW